MANQTIPDLTALGANVATGDLLEIADISNSNASRKVTQVQLLQGLTITPTTGTFTLANGATFQITVNGIVLDQNLETTASPTFAGITSDTSVTADEFIATGGSAAGTLSLTEGTAPSLTANAFKIYAAADVAAGGLAYILPAAAATGLMLATNAAGVMTITHVTSVTNLTLVTPVLGTPQSGNLSNCTALPASSLTAAVLGGTVTLGESTGNIKLDQTLSADGTWSGITVDAVAGYTQAFGDCVYLDPTDSRWELCDANSAAAADGDCRGTVGMVVVAGTDGNACTILLRGKIRADAKFPSFTVNNPIYISETAGALTQTQPTTTDVVIRIVGAALTGDEILFMPDNIWITHT